MFTDEITICQVETMLHYIEVSQSLAFACGAVSSAGETRDQYIRRLSIKHKEARQRLNGVLNV